MLLAQAVHTTGINWQGLLANVASIAVVVTVIAGVLFRGVKRTIHDEVTAVIEKDVKPVMEEMRKQLGKHDTRIARLEGVEEGKRQAVRQASVTANPALGE